MSYTYLESMYSLEFANGAENLVLQALQFSLMSIYRKFPGETCVSHYISNEDFMKGQFKLSA